ncbi:MAG: hypothetical protein M3512_07550 [Bacteroidota bacterium]|nr:hypothetical protein [Bacteroidota bacterium]
MDEVTNITEWHDKLLDYLNEYRQKHPDLKFTLRQRNNDKLEKRHWFLGNKNYIAIGFYAKGNSKTKTPSILFGITFDKYGKSFPHLYYQEG